MTKGNKGVYAVLLAGGKGARLWPLSTEKFPKSFIRSANRKPLIEDAITRLRGLADKANTLIVVNQKQKNLLKRFTKDILQKNVLFEPLARSTASAIGLAAITLDPKVIMVVLPTDNLIKNAKNFRKAIRTAIEFARAKKDALLCIGTNPTEPTSAYGYIKTKKKLQKGIYSVDKFIEKPKEKKATSFFRKKNYLWNTGMFIFRAASILSAMKKHTPPLYRELLRIKEDRKNINSAYERMKNVSIDYQIMEKARNLYCVKGDFSWQDFGNWKSVGKLLRKDRWGNAIFGRVVPIDTRSSIIYNSSKDKLEAVGFKDSIIAHTKNGTLVCRKRDAEKVKELVEKLNTKK